MKAVIPVKLSERLPYKHFLTLGEKTVIEIVYEKVSRVFETQVYSKIDVPVPHIRDESENIMELVYELKKGHVPFALIGGDMPFFTISDLELLRDSFSGRPVVPVDEAGNPEPMFSIYSGEPVHTRNLRETYAGNDPTYLDTGKFSRYAFFNINTREDYELAKELLQNGSVII